MILPHELAAYINMIISQYEYSMARVFILINDRSTGRDLYIWMLVLLERGKKKLFFLETKTSQKSTKNNYISMYSIPIQSIPLLPFIGVG